MESVGVRELKANLSRYLKRVRAGERIIVTDRKKEVAVIVPCGVQEEEKILSLLERGVAYWSGGRPKGMARRIVSKGRTVSQAVLDDRR